MFHYLLRHNCARWLRCAPFSPWLEWIVDSVHRWFTLRVTPAALPIPFSSFHTLHQSTKSQGLKKTDVQLRVWEYPFPSSYLLRHGCVWQLDLLFYFIFIFIFIFRSTSLTLAAAMQELGPKRRGDRRENNTGCFTSYSTPWKKNNCFVMLILFWRYPLFLTGGPWSLTCSDEGLWFWSMLLIRRGFIQLDIIIGGLVFGAWTD